jgi:hypothetical protein
MSAPAPFAVWHPTVPEASVINPANLLIGIVKKNAILMIDFAIDAERNQNASP